MSDDAWLLAHAWSSAGSFVRGARFVAAWPLAAVQLVPGDLGTKGARLTAPDARVLDEDRHPIAGLYATGNTSASVMGRTYPGPGATLGPGVVFGYRAVQHLVATA